MSAADFVVVYRGFETATLDLVEAMLRAEGLGPRRLGRANPALAGVGNSAVEQLIEVPREHEQPARALIAAVQEAPATPDQLADLEAQAMSAEGREGDALDQTDTSGPDLRLMVLLVIAAILVFVALR